MTERPPSPERRIRRIALNKVNFLVLQKTGEIMFDEKLENHFNLRKKHKDTDRIDVICVINGGQVLVPCHVRFRLGKTYLVLEK